jgi:hypothetical protein
VVNGGSYESETRMAFISDSWFLGQCHDDIGCARGAAHMALGGVVGGVGDKENGDGIPDLLL